MLVFHVCPKKNPETICLLIFLFSSFLFCKFIFKESGYYSIYKVSNILSIQSQQTKVINYDLRKHVSENDQYSNIRKDQHG